MNAALAYRVAAAVVDPELPMLTLADLGVLRGVDVVGETVHVTITPTYSGCPALAAMRTDLEQALTAAGFGTVKVRTVLSPAWSTDWISADGRRKLAAAGIAPPDPAPRRTSPRPTTDAAPPNPATRRSGPIPLTLVPPSTTVRCPRCGAADTEELSAFGPTACTALRRCVICREPFQHVKELA